MIQIGSRSSFRENWNINHLNGMMDGERKVNTSTSWVNLYPNMIWSKRLPLYIKLESFAVWMKAFPVACSKRQDGVKLTIIPGLLKLDGCIMLAKTFRQKRTHRMAALHAFTRPRSTCWHINSAAGPGSGRKELLWRGGGRFLLVLLSLPTGRPQEMLGEGWMVP